MSSARKRLSTALPRTEQNSSSTPRPGKNIALLSRRGFLLFAVTCLSLALYAPCRKGQQTLPHLKRVSSVQGLRRGRLTRARRANRASRIRGSRRRALVIFSSNPRETHFLLLMSHSSSENAFGGNCSSSVCTFLSICECAKASSCSEKKISLILCQNFVFVQCIRARANIIWHCFPIMCAARECFLLLSSHSALVVSFFHSSLSRLPFSRLSFINLSCFLLACRASLRAPSLVIAPLRRVEFAVVASPPACCSLDFLFKFCAASRDTADCSRQTQMPASGR